MLGSTHLILCRQMEHYTFPAIPINIYHRNIIYKYTYKLFPKRSLHTDTNISPECHHLHQIDHVWLETLCPQMQLDALPSQPKSGNFGQGCKFKSGRLYFHKFKCKLFITSYFIYEYLFLTIIYDIYSVLCEGKITKRNYLKKYFHSRKS
jgi:hypothetical protein